MLPVNIGKFLCQAPSSPYLLVHLGLLTSNKKLQPSFPHPHHRRCRLYRRASVWTPAKEGHDIIDLDNFFSGTKDNIAHLLAHPDLELLRYDVAFPKIVILYRACEPERARSS